MDLLTDRVCVVQLCVSDSGTLEVVSQGKVSSANPLADGAPTKVMDGETKPAVKLGTDPSAGLQRSSDKLHTFCHDEVSHTGFFN